MSDLATIDVNLTDRDLLMASAATTLADSATLTYRDHCMVDPWLSPKRREICIEAKAPRREVPLWVRPTIEALISKLELSSNWNNYGAPEILRERVFDAIDVLSQTMSDDTEAPWVVPTADGGIQLEWHRGDAEIEVEIPANRQGSIYFYNRSTEEEWEVSLTENLPRLSKALSDWMSRTEAFA